MGVYIYSFYIMYYFSKNIWMHISYIKKKNNQP